MFNCLPSPDAIVYYYSSLWLLLLPTGKRSHLQIDTKRHWKWR